MTITIPNKEMSLLRRLQCMKNFSLPLLKGAPDISTISRRYLPYCSVETNLKSGQLSDEFDLKFSKVLAKILGKDEKLITVKIDTNTPMCRNGSNQPNAVISIWSIGVFDADRNPAYSKLIYEFLLPELNIPADRIALFFHPIPKETAGHLFYAEMMEHK